MGSPAFQLAGIAGMFVTWFGAQLLFLRLCWSMFHCADLNKRDTDHPAQYKWLLKTYFLSLSKYSWLVYLLGLLQNPKQTFIYPFFTRGRPFPLQLLFFGMLFCIYNGFLQGYYLIYCAEYPNDWCTDIRFTSGLLLFLLGMGINIHSDLLLRQLRKPGEVTYKIPQGGLFTYVSGANYFGEIVEWFGFAIATWSLPAFAFAFFTLCCIGPRAYHHHRYQSVPCCMLLLTLGAHFAKCQRGAEPGFRIKVKFNTMYKKCIGLFVTGERQAVCWSPCQVGLTVI
ncbi:3-oxo-5-alpha-steroid 4-dehydrogenase 2 isoform X3 [Pithys albifrons albifrons]|uniref:3-oxo-5-alpha-steroid 4-dehydrogenase 2 isoform X3 n=1 Tax=Pithys albifrons albifrons TaxID=3385563 RepID=UPI003A5CEF96